MSTTDTLSGDQLDLVDVMERLVEDARDEPQFTDREHALMAAGELERGWLAEHDIRVRAEAESGQLPAQVVQLIRDLTDPDDCWFDHGGGCQTHGYISLGPGEECPHSEAKRLLAAHSDLTVDSEAVTVESDESTA